MTKHIIYIAILVLMAIGGLHAQVDCDFNGDGFADLAIGSAGENNSDGSITVIYGSRRGPNRSRIQLLTPEDPLFDLDYGMFLSYTMGYSMTHGDFNGDGFDDLAIGLSGYNQDIGQVTVLYGSNRGLRSLLESGSPAWTQEDLEPLSWTNDNDRFGHSMAAGDFDGDGFDDLAIGADNDEVVVDSMTNEIIGEEPSGIGGWYNLDGGAAHIIYGSASGLDLTRTQWFHQKMPGLTLEVREDDDGFGASMAVGDFNNDGADDLAVSAPGEDYEDCCSIIPGIGIVHVFYGQIGSGLQVAGNQILRQQFYWTGSEYPQVNEAFGTGLATGDFDGDGVDDLAVGTPGDDPAGLPGAGSVHQFFGETGVGLDVDERRYLHQALFWVDGGAQQFELFGYVLAAADINGDGIDDLSIGAPWDKATSTLEEGSVTVVYGYPRSQAMATHSQNWSAADFTATPRSDRYGMGSAVYSDDFNGDGFADLVIGSPFANTDATENSGEVRFLFAHPRTTDHLLTSLRSFNINQDARRIPGSREGFDFFGSNFSNSGLLMYVTRLGEFYWFPYVVEPPFMTKGLADEGELEQASPVAAPTKFDLSSNYPNPFNPSTTIKYAIKESGAVQLSVYNVAGQFVTTLINETQHASGEFSVSFDAANLPSGIYLYRLEAPGFVQTRKMTLMK